MLECMNLVGITLIWALGYPLGALGITAMPPMLLLACRFLLGALVLAGIAGFQKAQWPRGRLLLHTIVAGLLSQGVQFGGAYAGVAAGAPVAVAALVIALSPVLTALLGAVFLKEPLTRNRVIALVLGLGAVVAALGSRVLAGGGLDGGTLLVVLALVGAAGGAVYPPRFLKGVDVRAGASVQLTAAFVPTVIIASTQSITVSDPAKAIWVLAILVGVNSVFGTSLFLATIRKVGAARTSMAFSLVPAVSAVLSWLILGQLPTAGVVVGLVLGAAACVIGSRGGPVKAEVTTIRTAVEEQLSNR